MFKAGVAYCGARRVSLDSSAEETLKTLLTAAKTNIASQSQQNLFHTGRNLRR